MRFRFQDNRERFEPPWWLAGLDCIALCLISIYFDIKPFRIISLILGVYAIRKFIRFLRDFYKQRAQFSIKSVLIFTFCVAVFCSIYASLGLFAVLFVYSGVYLWIVFTWYWSDVIE
jgi:hypothetical protein